MVVTSVSLNLEDRVQRIRDRVDVSDAGPFGSKGIYFVMKEEYHFDLEGNPLEQLRESILKGIDKLKEWGYFTSEYAFGEIDGVTHIWKGSNTIVSVDDGRLVLMHDLTDPVARKIYQAILDHLVYIVFPSEGEEGDRQDV